MGDLKAVIFDVDGTLVDSERDGHRVAFNLAFEEFGLPYRWSVEEYGELLHTTGGQRRIEGYLKGQGVPEDERNRLAPALHQRKTAILGAIIDEGRLDVRPGVRRLVDELASAGTALAVATTGSRGWVEQLLAKLLDGVAFDVVVCGDEVEERKPDPEAYTTALAQLGSTPEDTVAVEDSYEGLESATAAGLATAVVVNGYTREHDLAAAALVLDGFGMPDAPATILADRAGTGCSGVIDLPTLGKMRRR